ncbi:hypothetical protein ACFPC0_13730 [Streptomyces andamanensis]|uniref:ATP-binding protein n=1 Tax=Streptomyces andamanensis TaxID=1565035 RepID=A0ABV8TEH9_9ACTN
MLLGKGTSITLEPSASLGDGVEFAYRHDGGTEVHQVKRQNRNANSWNVASLRKRDIWRNLCSHVEAGRAFHFVSMVPARALDELADRARRSDDVASFETEWLTEELLGSFYALASTDVYGSAVVAWRMLRGFWAEWPDERDLVNTNGVLAEQVLAGAPGRLAAAGLGDLLWNSLGTTLDAPAITARLGQYGLRRISRVDGAAVTDAVSGATRRWAASVERDLLRPAIPRQEVGQLVEQATQGTEQLILVTGAAGSGKSAVLHQTFTALENRGLPVLAFRLDRLGTFASTDELGRRIGLDMSPVGALGAVAAGLPCVLVVDQLDAVSLASGRVPDAFDAVADLVGEAAAHPAMRVVLVCRAFDAEADPRIRRFTTMSPCPHIAVGSLSDAQLDTAVASMGRNAAGLAPPQRALLRSPLHLVLLAGVADGEQAVSFRTTRQLFDEFWDTKRQQCERRLSRVRFPETVSAVVTAMSARQQLFVPRSVLDKDDLATSGDVLVSEHVLVRDGRQLAFFHESFFDYAFARHWLGRDESLVAFLTGGEQELFRRAQVRQVLDHLRDLDPGRFAEEIEALLTSPEIRYHLKEATLALLRSLDDPTAAEWDAVVRVLDTRPAFRAHLVKALSNAAWFRRADDEGAIEDWLTRADARDRDQAVTMMAGGADACPDRVARVLEPRNSAAGYGVWLTSILPYARLAGSRSLFDLVLDGVRTGLFADHELHVWMSAEDLAAEEPVWATELIATLLTERPDALRLDERGRVAALLTREHAALRTVAAAAAGAPEEFCARILPVLLGVMSATAVAAPCVAPVQDRHFAYGNRTGKPSDLGEALFQGAADALRDVATRDANRGRTLAEGLVGAPYESAQWLLYQALIGAGTALASWSAEILLEGRHRLLSGYVANVVWGAREVLLAIGDALPDDTLGRLEKALSHLRLPPHDELAPWHEFTLLTALPEGRLSEPAARRVAELRRRHGEREPDTPHDVRIGVIGSPIPSEAARHMSDTQWLRAMRKHSRDRTDWTTFTGGARQLSHVLQRMTTEDPDRFARLALRLDAGTHPAYGAAMLLGLGEADRHGDPETIFAAARHLAGQRKPAYDRWLGRAVRRHHACVPLDLVEILLDRALDADDTSDVVDDDAVDVDRDLLTAGINTVRGSAAESLGDLLFHDPDGSRATLVVPHLDRLAADPSLPVRACVAHLLGAAMRHDRPAAADAFRVLVQAPDQLLASPHVTRLFVALCHGDPKAYRAVMERMLRSRVPTVRRVGGQVAVLAAMEWETRELLDDVLAGNDREQRQGAADVCAQRFVNIGDAELAHHALVRFFHDPEEEVREAAAGVAAALRGRRLAPVRRTVTALIESRAFEPALPQLLLTLEHAPDRVDELVLLCVRRFLKVFGAASAELSRGAAADARHIGDLLVRALTQAGPAARRSDVLDLLDQLLLLGAYGVTEAISRADRG